MKRILILLLLAMLLLSACTAPTSCSADGAALRVGMTKEEALTALSKVTYVEAKQYVFYPDTNDNSNVLYFDANGVLSRIETIAPPARDLEASEIMSVAPGTSIYEVVQQFGIPSKHTSGSHYQLTFSYSARVTIITTWSDDNTDHMSLKYNPHYIDLSVQPDIGDEP